MHKKTCAILEIADSLALETTVVRKFTGGHLKTGWQVTIDPVTCRLVKAVSSYNFHASLSTHLR